MASLALTVVRLVLRAIEPPSSSTSRSSPTSPLILPRILPRHPRRITSPLPPFPKPFPNLLSQHGMADATIVRAIILLPAAEAAQHAIGELVRMIGLLFVVAAIAREDLTAAGETEPSVAFAVVGAASFAREGRSCCDAEVFSCLFPTCCA